MATRFLERHAGTAPLTTAKTDSAGNVAPIGVDSSDESLKYYDRTAGVVRSVYDGRDKTLTPTGAVVLTATQTGTNVWLNAAGGFAITLPAVAAGLNFRFTVAAAFATTNFTIITPGLVDLIFGGATVAGADVPADAEDTISFVATVEAKGDFVDVWSDGVSWFVNGRGTTAGSITFTQAG